MRVAPLVAVVFAIGCTSEPKAEPERGVAPVVTATTAPEAVPSYLEGVVRDGRTQERIPRFFLHVVRGSGAMLIRVGERAVSADRIELPVGPLILAFDAPGFEPVEREVVIGEGRNEIEVEVHPCPVGTIEGVARLTPPPTPFQVKVSGVPYVFDDPQGRFSIPNVRAGKRLVLFSRDDFTMTEAQRRVTVAEGGTTRLEVDLAHPGSIDGVLLDPHGAPMPGIHMQTGFSLSGTDAQGRFSLPALQPGLHVVRAVARDYDPLEEEVRVEEGKPTTCRLSFRPAMGQRKLRGTIPDTPPGTLVTLHREGSSSALRSTRLDARRKFVFKNLDPGTYRVVCGRHQSLITIPAK